MILAKPVNETAIALSTFRRENRLVCWSVRWSVLGLAYSSNQLVAIVSGRRHSVVVAFDVEISDSHLYFARVCLEVGSKCILAPV